MAERQGMLPLAVSATRAAWLPALDRLTYLAALGLLTAAPFEVLDPIIAFPPIITFTYLKLLIWLVIALWLARNALSGRWPGLDTPLALPILAFLAVMLASLAVAPAYKLEAFKAVNRSVNGMVAYLVAVTTFTTGKRIEAAFKGVIASAMAVAALGLLEAAGVAPAVAFLSLFKERPTYVGGLLRVSATFQYATILAVFLEMAAPLLIGYAAVREGTGRRLAWPAYAGLALVLEALILTFTRSALAGLGAGLVAMLALAWRRGLRPAVRPVLAGGAITLLLLAFTAAWNQSVAVRFATENDSGWFSAAYDPPGPLALQTGETVPVEVGVTNLGRATWVAGGERPFALSYHWVDPQRDRSIGYAGARAALPHDVAPGQSVRVSILVTAPAQSGPWLIEWDMIQTGILWFAQKGSATAQTPVDVAPGPVAAPALPAAAAEPVAVKAPDVVDRRTLWTLALKMFLARPLLGVGPDNFRQVYGEYAGMTAWDRGIHANNMYLEAFADLGLLGGIALLAVLISAVRLALSAIFRRPDGPLALWALAVAGSLAAFLTHSFFDYFLEFTSIYLLFWMLLGLVASIATRTDVLRDG